MGITLVEVVKFVRAAIEESPKDTTIDVYLNYVYWDEINIELINRYRLPSAAVSFANNLTFEILGCKVYPLQMNALMMERHEVK